MSLEWSTGGVQVTRVARLRNDDRKRSDETEGVHGRIGKKRLRWFGYCMRMSEERCSCLVDEEEVVDGLD